jgi:hypothetical protein
MNHIYLPVYFTSLHLSSSSHGWFKEEEKEEKKSPREHYNLERCYFHVLLLGGNGDAYFIRVLNSASV